MNIRISPEELRERAKRIVDNAVDMNAIIDDMQAAMETLDPWKSPNKDLFFEKLRLRIKDLREMNEAALSYGAVGQDVANRVIDVENRIRDSLLSGNDDTGI